LLVSRHEGWGHSHDAGVPLGADGVAITIGGGHNFCHELAHAIQHHVYRLRIYVFEGLQLQEVIQAGNCVQYELDVSERRFVISHPPRVAISFVKVEPEGQFQLYELAQGAYAFTPVTQGYGHTTIGLVIDSDGLTIIDSGPTPAAGEIVKDEIRALTAELGLPIKRVVVTSSRVPFAGGTNAFWPAAYYGTEAVSAQLDSPVNIAALHALLPQFALAYNDEFATRPITHTIAHRTPISGAAEAIPLPGEGPANLVVMLESANVVFAGALGSFGVTPLAFDGHPEAWARSIRLLANEGVTIVPGHGSPGGMAAAIELADYLDACVSADGDPAAIGPGPWEGWTDRRFDAVNTERAARLARDDHEIPNSMFELLGMDAPS